MNKVPESFGRVVFSRQTYEMLPSLPDDVEMRIQVFYLAADSQDNCLLKAGFMSFEQISRLRQESKLFWVHLSGNFNDEFWREFRNFADLSDEQLKYLRRPHKLSFVDESYNGLFWTIMCPTVGEELNALEVINFFLGDRMLVTRQFSHDDAFAGLVHKLMSQGDELQLSSADCLAAELTQSILFRYFDVLSIGGTKLELLQNKIIRNPGKQELELINTAQQLIWIFLKTLWPVENVAQRLVRSKSKWISEDGKNAFEQCLETAESVLGLFETYREMSYDIMDVYVSGLGLRTNETTKILTVIATLFLPPTLIAGIYGMNFQIPEINFPYGYQVALAAMFSVSGGMVWWLRKNDYIDF